VTPANLRIRFAIARDQYERELEQHFKLAHYGLAADLRFPSHRMIFWDERMTEQLAEGWVNFVR
jgi:hypothetical protein